MANKKYYWLKLTENFFDEDTIIYIESQENGEKYSNFYLKLCLKSLRTDGKLIRLVGENFIPYDIKSLARLTNCEIDTVRAAMQLFEAIGIIQILDTGEIYLTQVKEMVGSETDKAKIMRRLRAEKAQQMAIGNNVTGVLPECYTEIRDKSIELKSIDNKEKNSIKKESAGAHNKKFVKPTVEEVKEYCQERKNSVDANRFVDYYEANGWKVGRNSMKDWKAAVRTWERREVGGLQSRNIENSASGSDFEDAIF